MNTRDDDVAVIGMAGRFPGANGVREFWSNLCAGKEGIRRLSDDELRMAGVAERDIADSLYVKASASLDGVDRFDAGFFKISPLEAELMDPQIRLLLQCAWEALEDAGHARKEAQNIGVFAGAGGVTTSYLSNFVNIDQRFERTTAGPAHLGNDKDFLATYISYKLNLTGPSVTVQTACSTSLVALHQARSSLLSGECDMALAGGVTVRVPHGHGYRYKEGYIFSRSGSIKTFDEGADGVVFGSGLGLVLIRRLSDALRDGDPIYAVIKGSAIGNDGKGKMSYAASSAKGQIACARAALKNAAVEAGSIGFVESHGTGTSMGDPEEVKALSAAFKEQTDKKAYCALGAVKTNIGHLEAAAGIAGFIKAVLAVQHGLIPPTLHYEKPNPRIRFENTPFRVNGELLTWDAGEHPRRAAVNSLGLGGTNAFVIVEQHVARARPASQAQGPFIVPLSAKTEASLQAYARRLADFLESDVGHGAAVDLESVAYTLQTGREAMERRVAFVVSTIEELKASLSDYLQGEPVRHDPGEAADRAAAWAAGADVDWPERYAHGLPRRTHLPTYVFAQDRHWIDTAGVAPSRPVIHPLLHTNTSDLDEQRYSATFTGEEFFLKDHQVRIKRQQKILPGVAYLEMARAAIEQAAPAHRDDGILELRSIAWLQPIAVAQDKQVNIAVLPRDETPTRIDFEVYTDDDQIHCHGQCIVIREADAPVQLDTAALKAAMRRGRTSADEIYRAFAKMGLHYGPAHRSIVSIERGDRQLMAHLMLPETLAADEHDYVLHPSLMDGALQAATALLFDPHEVPGQPIVPFALDALRIVAPCRPAMDVWVRFAPDSRPDDKSARLDIDLLDAEGQVCVQMRGFMPRALGKENPGSLLATQTWTTSDPASEATAHGQQHVIVCDLPQVQVHGIARDAAALQLDHAKTLAERYAALSLACFDKLQTLIRAKPQVNTLVQVVLPDTTEHAAYAGLSGLFKTARLENPRIAGQIVFVDPGIGADELGRLLQAECGHPHDTLIRHGQGVRQVAGWQMLHDDAAGAFDRDGPFKEQGVYLITGGLGGLGVLFANEILARTPSAAIVLTGRAPLQQIEASAGKRAILESLQAGGATVEYAPVDLADRDDVQRLVADLIARHKRLNGVIHCAGMTRDGFILKKAASEFSQVLEPKTIGTENLDAATRGVDLDFMVLFSSLTSAAGNAGQADYAAANGFLDTFAAHRNRLVRTGERRGTTLAIRWPLWQDGGMQPDAAAKDLLHEATGIHPMTTATGMRMFYRSLALGIDQTLVMEGDLNLMHRTLGIGAALHAATAETAEPDTPQAEVALDSDLADRTERYLGRQLATALKLAADKIDARAPLQDYGIDSVLALDLTLLLEKTFGALPKTLFFEYLTIRELAAYFVESHAARLAALFAAADTGAATPKPNAAPAAVLRPSVSIRAGGRRFLQASQVDPALAAAEPIAIIGLSGRYPESVDLQAFWRHLRDGDDCIVEVPKDRWDWRDYYSDDRAEKGRHYSRWGGFIEGVDEFDARFFSISPVEAATIDPQERLFLQHAWMAMEDAGCTRAAMQIANGGDLPGQVGVYAGVMYGEYQLFGAEASLQGQHMGFASNLASIANRVSYVLNLHGPSMVVDTMCSSSLTAIHLACQDLKLGRTSMAIAGGVNVTIHPNKYLMLSAGQFISGDGHCQSFGEGGDGYIPGEGVGVVVLKRLSDAVRDGNPIHGVIKGSALSHGGRTSGYTVPNPQAQASAIRQALAEARVDARHVTYLEAHGTGTKLGDPIEIAALSKVFQESTQDIGFCRIGSAKSNIGHAEAAAGIAGLTKVLLQMQHRRIVPSLHSSRLNPHIDFGSSPFIVNQTLTPWEAPVIAGRPLPRIAGISSFGAGGSNAHLIVEEYVPPVASATPADGVELIVPLSARTPEQLRQKARDLVAFVRAPRDDQKRPLSLSSLAYTLQVGREAMDERLAVLADSVEGLASRLQSWLDGEAREGVYPGQVKAHKEAVSLLEQYPDLHVAVAKSIAARHNAKLADLWAKGLALDWTGLHAVKPALISLPGYPFARQRFWVDAALDAAPRRQTPKGPAMNVLHPLVHRNTSDFDEHSYASTFSADEFFVTGESGHRCLTPAAYLEMARVAIELAVPSRQASQRLELHDIAWAQPGIALGDDEVRIALFDRIGERATFEIHSGDSVHCQGRVAFSEAQAPAGLDLARIKSQDPQALMELSAPPARVDAGEAYVLDPALVQQALENAARLASDTARPVSMASLRIVTSSSQARFAWTRASACAEGAIDMDLCDELGSVCVQMRGLRCAAGEVRVSPVDAAAVAVAPIEACSAGEMRIPFDMAPAAVVGGSVSAKPSRSIQLASATSTAVSRESGSSGKPTVALSTPLHEPTAAQPLGDSSVALFDRGNGIFAIRVDAPASGNGLSPDVIADLLRAMRTVEQAPSAKVLMLEGADGRFLTGGLAQHRDALAADLYRALAEFPYPVMAVVRGDALGAGFLLAAVCDFMVCAESARLSFALPGDLFPSAAEALMAERFGRVRATDFLWLSAPATAADLKAKGWTCPILPRDRVDAFAHDLAADLAGKSQTALRLLKHNLAHRIASEVKALPAPVERQSDDDAVPAVEDLLETPSRRLELRSHRDRVLVVTIRAQEDEPGAQALLADLQALSGRLGDASPYRCVVLASELAGFVPTAAGVAAGQIAQAFARTLLGLKRPIVAALSGDAQGLAWVVAQHCDACVYSQDGRYSASDALRDPMLHGVATSVFSRSLGDPAARRLLLAGAEATGAELRDDYRALHVVSAEDVLDHALSLADALAAFPVPQLSEWKRRTALLLQARAVPAAHEPMPQAHELAERHAASAPVAPTLASKVVSAIAHPEGILEVHMADRDAGNGFSEALSSGLREVFAHVEDDPSIKVVVLTGHDNLFSTGGTRDTLLAIHEGRARFTDNTVFHLPLACSVPVIAAMQGHGIGAGWALGAYADCTLYSDESRYASPYMRYGFTPGAGATQLFAERIGHDLARETLLTAREYAGDELHERGLADLVRPRDRVLPAAMSLARRIAQSPRGRLAALKRRWAEPLRAGLQETFERELAMHERTFVGVAETLKHIQGRFGIEAAAPSPAAAPATPPAPRQHAADLAAIMASLKKMLAHELRMQEDEIGDDEQFVDLGLDSITGVTWIRSINDKYGTAIEAIKVYSHPTLAQLSRFVRDEAMQAGTLAAAAPVGAPVEAPAIAATAPTAVLTSWRRRGRTKARAAAASSESIAVVGMSGQFAKARDLGEFWHNIAQGRDCIDEVPKHRWDIDRYYQPGEAAPGKATSRWMGALDDPDLFDAAFFNISPREARSMDPQQRLFLQACWHSIEHAGYNPKALAGSRCGVFVGCSAGDYHQLSRREQLSGQGFTGAAPSILAARISYFLDLHGPSLSIDTACSSSLVAIATSCDNLAAGHCDIALAGGVNVMAGPSMQIMTSQVGMLSPDGRCFTFDDRANGIVNGEGVGVVMLKRLSDAQRDGDCIYGVIEGWGVNQDGKTNGITAPNADSQMRLQQAVYDRFGIDPAGIQLVEAHGTGTALGDPIEVAALKASFAKYTRNAGYCALGSVKSNIGHCLTAAGVSGFLKVLLALEHEQLPPTIHFSKLNRHIALEGSPFYVNDELREWKRMGAAPRRAAVSSFGFSGTNAHIVVAEYSGPQDPVAANEPAIVPLSARTADQLEQQARELLAFVRRPAGQRLELSRLAYTLQVGREPMNERAAFIAGTRAELEIALQSFVDGVAQVGQVVRGRVDGKDTLVALSADPEFQAMVSRWIGRRELPRLADLWVKGVALDWTAFHAEGLKPRRVGLPVYPFAKERFWIEPEQEDVLVIDCDRSGMDAEPKPSPAVTPVVQQTALGGVKQPAPVPSISLQQLQGELKSSLAEALFMQPSDVDVNKPFTELGLDSIIGVEWVKVINKRYGTHVSATRIYDHPSVKELASYLASERPVDSAAQAFAALPQAAPRGIRFAPQGAKASEGLHFRITGAEGDFEREGEFSVRCTVSPDTNICLKEHVVFGEHLLPTDAYIELVVAAYRSGFSGDEIQLKNIAIANPILGAKGRDTHVKVVFRRAGDALQFFVKSSTSPDFRDDTLNMQGFIAAADDVPESRFDDAFAVEKTLNHDEIPTNTGTCYAPLQSLHFGQSAALGIIRVARHEWGFVANPFALYGGLCTAINYGGWLAARHHGAGDDQFLPYRVGRIAFVGAMDGADFRCCVHLRSIERDSVELDVDIVDSTGRLVVAMDSLVLRRVARAALASPPSAARRQPVTERDAPARGAGARTEKVAIIGMSCRYPMSENVDAFWQNLKAGRDCISEVPSDRWGDQGPWYHPDPRHPNTSYSKWGGFLDRIDAFDPLFFGISPAEAELIDPQQRIFLEECWKAIESAGHAPGALSNRSCGVYVGCGGADYARVLAQAGHDTAGAAFMGTSSAILAARISYLLNLKGPALAIDTACSSSLVAVHLACESIRNGENEMALAGGINLLTTPIGHILTSQVGMPSRDGRCAPFDASANGIVFSEGCGVLLLKSLSAALRDNDDILGVIQGSGINQDGRTNGITAPSAKAQERLLRQVYEGFGVDPRRIGYVEAHGTATALGDPIEVQALSSAFGPGMSAHGPEKTACALGSVKSNIGHTGFAAGVAGIVKVLLCMKHRKLVPSLHYRRSNPHIDFERSPFEVNTQYRDWASDAPRLAAISSFGFSGTNAHVVIEEHVAQSEPMDDGIGPKREVFVPLSAKTAEQLQQVARDLLQFVRGCAQPVDLTRLAYTLQVGRDAMDHRLGVIATSADELADKLQAWIDGRARIDGVHRGQASQGDDTLAAFAADADMRRVIDGWIAQKKLAKIAELWVKGFELDPNRLHDGPAPRRMALPTYPFARERCWAEPVAAGPREAKNPEARAMALLHPLLQRNTSNLGRQSYTSVFAGDEFFLADHRVGGQRVLPAVVHLEMARAALLDAMPQDMPSRHVELRHVVWAQPIVAREGARVEIDVYAEDATRLGFEICSRETDDAEEMVNCQGTCVLVDKPAPQRLDLETLRARMQRPILDGGVLYPLFATLGLEYGPAFQGIAAVHRGDCELLVELKLPDALREARADYVLHPSLMDSALQGSITLIDDVLRACGKPSLPFALESLRIFSACTERMVAWVRPAEGAAPAASGLVKVDIDLCDPDGQVCVQMRGFSSRSAAGVRSLDDVAAGLVAQNSRR